MPLKKSKSKLKSNNPQDKKKSKLKMLSIKYIRDKQPEDTIFVEKRGTGIFMKCPECNQYAKAEHIRELEVDELFQDFDITSCTRGTSSNSSFKTATTTFFNSSASTSTQNIRVNYTRENQTLLRYVKAPMYKINKSTGEKQIFKRKFQFKNVLVKCSICDATFNYKEFNKRSHDLTVSTVNQYMNWSGIFENPFTVKLRFLYKQYYFLGGNLISEPVSQHIILNAITGQSYLVEPWVYGKRSKHYAGPKIKNISYFPTSKIGGIPQETYNELYETVYAKISKQFSFKLPRFEDYATKRIKKRFKKNPFSDEESIFEQDDHKNIIDMNLEKIILFNRFPTLNPEIAKKLISICKSMYSTGNRKLAQIKNTETNIYGKLIEIFRLPNIKTVRKLLTQDIEYIGIIMFLNSVFKEPANIINVSNNEHLKTSFSSLLVSSNGYKFLKRFIKQMILESKSETIVANKLKDIKDFHILMDAATSYEKIKQKKPEMLKGKTKQVFLVGNITEIHDELTAILEVFNHRNKKLSYTKKDKALEWIHEDYTFHLSKDTNEMRTVGKLMHICVGTLYVEKAVKKQCNILFVSKGDRYVACIELRTKSSDENNKLFKDTIKQSKCAFNARPKEELKDILLEWANLKSLNIDTFDLKIKEQVQTSWTGVTTYQANQVLNTTNITYSNSSAIINIIQENETELLLEN